MLDILNNPYAIKGLHSLGLGLVVFLLVYIASRIASKGGKRSSETHFAIKYTAICFFGVALIFIWLEGVGPILTALTIVAAALTIVSKELILNFLGSFVIFWRELFAIGDRIQVGDSSGDVIDKGLLYFTLLEIGRTESTGHSTGRLIKIPNSLALTLPIINATRGAGYVWHEVKVVVTSESDWENAKAILLTAISTYYEQEKVDLPRIKKEFERKRIFFNILSPRAYVDVANGGIKITLRYLNKSRLTQESHDFVITHFLHEIKQTDITLANKQV